MSVSADGLVLVTALGGPAALLPTAIRNVDPARGEISALDLRWLPHDARSGSAPGPVDRVVVLRQSGRRALVGGPLELRSLPGGLPVEPVPPYLRGWADVLGIVGLYEPDDASGLRLVLDPELALDFLEAPPPNLDPLRLGAW